MSNSAVARVFGIAELRELILLAIPYHRKSEDAQEHPYQPVIQLFVLQRVNREFRDTIIGSIALRSRMTTPPLVEFRLPPIAKPQVHAWSFGKHIGKTIGGLVRNSDGSRALQQSTKGAIWRQLKARNAEDPGQPTGLWYEPKPMDCSDGLQNRRMNIVQRRRTHLLFPGHYLEFTKETTWGNIFDWVIDKQIEAMEDFMSYLQHCEDER